MATTAKPNCRTCRITSIKQLLSNPCATRVLVSSLSPTAYYRFNPFL